MLEVIIKKAINKTPMIFLNTFPPIISEISKISKPGKFLNNLKIKYAIKMAKIPT